MNRQRNAQEIWTLIDYSKMFGLCLKTELGVWGGGGGPTKELNLITSYQWFATVSKSPSSTLKISPKQTSLKKKSFPDLRLCYDASKPRDSSVNKRAPAILVSVGPS